MSDNKQQFPTIEEFVLANIDRSGMHVLCQDQQTNEIWVNQSRGELVEELEPQLTEHLPIDLLARMLYQSIVAWKYTEGYVKVFVTTRADVQYREFSFIREGRVPTHMVEWMQQYLGHSMEEWEDIKFKAQELYRCSDEEFEAAMTAVALVGRGVK